MRAGMPRVQTAACAYAVLRGVRWALVRLRCEAHLRLLAAGDIGF